MTEVAESTKILHVDSGKAVTMEMKVAVTGTGSGETYSAVLRRAIGDDLALKFEAQAAASGSLDAVHNFIRALANDVGEYADWTNDARIATRVRATNRNGLTTAARDKCDSLLAARRTNGNDARFSDDDAFFEIRMVGETVGFVCNVDDYLQDPMWDGSGMHYYLDKTGNLVVDVEWSA